MLRKYFFKALIGASIIYLIDFILFFPMYTNQTFNDNTTFKKKLFKQFEMCDKSWGQVFSQSTFNIK